MERAQAARAKWAGAGGGLSLHMQVTLVIAVLSFLPNLVMALVLLLPDYGRLAQLSPSFWLPLALWLVAVALLSAGIGFFLSRQLLAPLTRLAHQIDLLQARPGRLSKLATAGNEPREILALKASFNELVAQVNLEGSRRNAFMATLMHDLKTPLIAANHLLTVVRDTDSLSREERIELVSRLLSENQGLTELVQKLVDAHKFERDEVPLTREACRLETVVARVIERVRPLAEARGIGLTLRGGAGAVVDARELERALSNLLGNALRYARKKISVEIFSGVIRLSDDGPGLPAPLEKLAQPFNAQPVDIAGGRYTAGTGGLGLFIARRIIEAHGGRLITETTGPQGTVLLIYLGAS